MVITVLSGKGGTAKTTTVVTLARLWHTQRPLILDTDRQQGVSKYRLKGVTVLPAEPKNVAETLAAMLRGESRLVFIDCPPDAQESRQAIKSADLIIVPAPPEPADLDAARTLIAALKGRPARLLFTKYAATYRDDVNELSRKYPKAVFNTRINRARPVADAYKQGLTILDTAPESLPARQYRKLGMEIESLWQ